MGDDSMRCLVILAILPAFLGTGPQQLSAPSKSGEKVTAPVLARTFPMVNVGGAADRTGIQGRIDHMNYDPATDRLFMACVANGSLEVIDLGTGKRAGTISGLQGPQGVAVAGGFVYVATGGDGKLHRFDTRTLAAEKSVPVGDDADNVRVARDGKIWVTFGGPGHGGLACFDEKTLAFERKLSVPRMPEGFQVHPDGVGLFANLPAGKQSAEDGTVVGLKRPDGEYLWQRKLTGRAGNFPMTIDPANDRVFVVTRNPARLISLNTRDGSVLGETPCPPEADDVLFDARSGSVAVIGGGARPASGDAGGAGASLDLFAIDGMGRPSRLGGTPLPPHSRTGALAADRRAIYVGVPGTQSRPAEVREYRLLTNAGDRQQD